MELERLASGLAAAAMVVVAAASCLWQPQAQCGARAAHWRIPRAGCEPLLAAGLWTGGGDGGGIGQLCAHPCVWPQPYTRRE